VVLTAAHCVVREEPGSNSGAVCTTKLSRLEFRASNGVRQPIEWQRRRAYVPGQTFEQLTGSQFETPNPTGGLCAEGARHGLYYGTHRSEDVAVLGLEAPVTGITPMDPWLSPSQDVSGFLGGPFTWVGRWSGATEKFTASGMGYGPAILDACPVAVTGPAPFFFKEIAGCVAGEGMLGMMEGGDSGGPLLVDDNGLKIAGVASGLHGKKQAGVCPNPGPAACTSADKAYNAWGPVPANAKFIQQAPEWAENDWDGDSVNNDVDNCRIVPNADQANANLDFELAAGSRKLGDACDPSAVGYVAPGHEWPVWGAQADKCGPNLDPDTDPWQQCCALRANRWDWRLFTTLMPSAQYQVTSPTGFRYCVCRDASGNAIGSKSLCKDEHGCLIDNNEFPKTAPNDPDPLKRTNWLHMGHLYQGKAKLDQAGGFVDPGPPWEKENGESIAYKAGTFADGYVSWNWPYDASWWSQSGWLPPPEPQPPPEFPAGWDIPGLLWTHNASTAGSDTHWPSPTTCGTEPSGTTCGFGNSYTFFNPSRRTYACPMLPNLTDLFGGGQTSAMSASANSRFTPPPSLDLGVPLIATPDASGAQLPFPPVPFAQRAIQPGFAVPCGTSDDEIAEASLPGMPTAVISDVLSPSLRQLLRARPDLLWIAPSEPPEVIGSGANPLMLAVDKETGEITNGMTSDGQGGLRDLSRCDTCDRDFVGAKVSKLAQSSSATLGPSAYSRIAGELVQLVGSTADGALDRLRITRLGEGVTERPIQPASRRPMTAQAALYTQHDGRLWLVGTQSTSGKQRRSYLFVIDTFSGAIEVQRRLFPMLSRVWLASTERHEVVLAAAPDHGPWYMTALLRAEAIGMPARAALSGVALASGRLMGAPRASGDALLALVGKPGPGLVLRPRDPREYEVRARDLASLRGIFHHPCFDD
jgi:hypothetical protein